MMASWVCRSCPTISRNHEAFGRCSRGFEEYDTRIGAYRLALGPNGTWPNTSVTLPGLLQMPEMLPENFTVLDVLMDPGPAPIKLRHCWHGFLQSKIEPEMTAHVERALLRVVKRQQKETGANGSPDRCCSGKPCGQSVLLRRHVGPHAKRNARAQRAGIG